MGFLSFSGVIVWLILSEFIFASTSEESVIDDRRDFESHFASLGAFKILGDVSARMPKILNYIFAPVSPN